MEAEVKKRYTIAEAETFVAQSGMTALLFTSPNCQYCGPAKEQLEKLIEDGTIRAVVIDAPSSQALAEYASVMGVPSLQLYNGGKFERSASGNKVVKLLKELA